MRVLGVFVLGAAACYAPDPQPGAPCADGACPTGLVCAPLTQTCERPGGGGSGGSDVDASTGDAPMRDASMLSTDASPDARACFGSGLVTICPSSPITTALSITSNTTVDTDASTMCIAYTGDGAGMYCVVAGTTVSIATNRRLRGNGSKPLLVLATDALTVDGTIDVSAGAGANPSTCVAPTAATGAQGGAGGSFQGKGGSGAAGVSGLGPMASPGTTTVALRGGCAGGKGAGGGGGTGGSGGGAVYLIGSTITINGTLNASGAAGSGASSASGGGGGGAGGFIGLDAPAVTIASGARVYANGGGGGEGATPNHGGNSGSAPGSPTSAASGGSGGANHGGNGGSGSAGATLTGSDGNSGGNCGRNGQSGGGGGGGAGFVYVFPTQTLGGSVSPPPGG